MRSNSASVNSWAPGADTPYNIQRRCKLASLAMEGVESNACYILMEDNARLTGRCMTLPHTSTSHPNGRTLPPPRTATFSAPLNHTRIAAAVAPAVPTAVTETATEKEKGETVFAENTPLQPRVVKTGILRQSVVRDVSERKPPRIKKHVSINLPEPSQPKLASRRRYKRAATVDAIPEEDNGVTVVQAGFSDTETPEEEEEEEEAHVSAVELLNPSHDEEETDEQDIIILRDKPRRQPSLRENLTNSLSRIGNRMRRGKPPKLRRLQSTLDFDRLAKNELELKANLYWHIATPIKRWKVEGQVPIKLVLQLLKTLCLIVQVVLFTNTIAHKRGEFFFDSRIVFESLFIVDFDADTALQQRILYNINEVSREIDFIATNYYKLPDVTIGGYDHVKDEDNKPVPIQFRLQQYRVAILNASESRFVLDGHVDEINFNVSRFENATQTLFDNSQDPLFHKFVDLRIKIPVNVIRIEAPQKAECYRFDVEIQFVNDDHNGKFLYDLRTKYARNNKCKGRILYDDNRYEVIKATLIILNLIVLKFCLLSLFLTAKTLRRAYRLGKAMGRFYHECLNLPLTWRERRSLFSSWHYINIISDLLITSGTLYKILLEFEVVLDASAARILLGTALLFQAAVILRYVNYFKQVNALTRTLALAFPELMKFLLCGSVLFFAFALCGWIVLGPFHPKFTDFNDTIETLFALLNGDDIYNTYILLDPEVDYLAYIYSRIFLYVFLGLFIYAVLNLFTSLVISAHEISQNKDTAVGNEVRRFVFSGPLTPRGVALRDVTSTSKYVDPALILNKAQRKRKNSSDDDDDDS